MAGRLVVSVVGGHECGASVYAMAEKTGRIIAEEGAVLMCGGLSGVMEAACKGAKSVGGLTIGMLPGDDKHDANRYVDIAITTGMGYSRNTLVAGGPDVVVALPGKCGTLSEIGFALGAKKPVYTFGGWKIDGVHELVSPEELRAILSGHEHPDRHEHEENTPHKSMDI
ncbi:MAG: TIGR00725 family protein [Candidatus Omnitrophica bacterium]|nr:TIGR00725 family protein [Candidatus Omnitrophota bacterium]MDD5487673.1 TIGR00725 family protein [Candidatus Omnitrophota bacterium]